MQQITSELNHDLNQTDISIRLSSHEVRLAGVGILILVAVEVVAVLLAWSQRQHLMEIASEEIITNLRQKLLQAPDPQDMRTLQQYSKHVSSENENLRLRLQARVKSELHENLIIDNIVHSINLGITLADYSDASDNDKFLGVFVADKKDGICEELKDVILYSRLTYVGGMGEIIQQNLSELSIVLGQYKKRPLRLRFEYTRDSEIVEAYFHKQTQDSVDNTQGHEDECITVGGNGGDVSNDVDDAGNEGKSNGRALLSEQSTCHE